MSFWSVLGDIGAAVAAPFTGGASLAAIPAISAISNGSGNQPSVASNVATTAGSAEAARLQALANQTKAQQGQDALQLQREKLALQAPGMEAGNSVRGDILANAQDATVSGLPSYITVPTMSGGLRPSMLSSNSRQLGSVMSRNALANELSGKDVAPLTPLPQPSTLDSILSGTATGAGFLNAVGPLLKNLPSTQTPVAGSVPYGPQDPDPYGTGLPGQMGSLPGLS